MRFYEALSKYYDLLFPAGAAQVRFVEARVKKGGQVLDVAAGTGNLAVELCKRNFPVTALDLDGEMVRRIEAKQSAAAPGPLTAMQMDMRKIGTLSPRTFDAILCIGNSIVHLNDIGEVRSTIVSMEKLLKEDGVLIVQTVNYDRILRERITELPLIEKTEDNVKVTFRRLYEFTGENLLFHGKLSVEEQGGVQETANAVPLLPLQSQQLEAILRESGFSQVDLYGSFQGEPYGKDSPALVAAARK